VNDAHRKEIVHVTDHKPTKIALAQITTLEQGLDQVPAHSATEISKARAIAMLGPKLHAMRAKGYAWRDVAAWLTEHGLAVTVPALQRYLREGKTAQSGGTRARSRARSGRSRDVDTSSAPSATASVRAPASSPAAGPTASVQRGPRT